jgi:hypothetical protein
MVPTTRLRLIALIAGSLLAAASASNASSWSVSTSSTLGQALAATLAAPSAPASSCASNTTATVSWSAVGHATGYAVYQATSSSGPYSLVATTAGTTWTSGTLPPGSTYFWKVASRAATNWLSAQSGATAGRTLSSTPNRCS